MSDVCLMEAFESRRLMSVVPVTSLANNGVGSLREAVRTANDGDVLDLRGLSGVIQLAVGAPITLERDLTLLGPGEDVLSVAATAGPVFTNNAHNTVMEHFTITGGDTVVSGGGILTAGDLTLHNMTLKDNKAFLFGGAIYGINSHVSLDECTVWGNTVQGALEARGGGIYLEGGSLTVTNSTFSQNKAIGQSNLNLSSGPGLGGAVYLHATGDSSFTNSTFGDNTAQGGTGGLLINNGNAYGGAMYLDTTHDTLLNHVTVAHNDAMGGGLSLQLATSSGGGVYSAGTGTVTTSGSIVALNSASTLVDMLAVHLSSLGDNVIGAISGSSIINGLLGDRVGTALAPLAPGLTALADNGGPTMTYGLQPTSPAVNTGASVDTPLLDQRGLGRRDAADSGSFEYNANHLPQIVGTNAVAVAGVAFNQPLGVVDGDNDDLTVTGGSDMPSWLSVRKVDGVWSLVGKPTELQAAAVNKFHVNVYDGFQTNTTLMSVKVGIPGIDLSASGLLRLNGTEFDDELSVSVLPDKNTVRVYRDGFKRNFPLASVKKIQLFGFGGNDNILVDVARVRSTIFAGDGNDTVRSGAAADYISGGSGDDRLFGGGGADRIDADGGRDRVYGEDGDDILHGGDGRDILDGGRGRNRLFGDAGNDLIYSVLGAKDVVYGGPGDNGVYGNATTTVVDAVLLAN